MRQKEDKDSSEGYWPKAHIKIGLDMLSCMHVVFPRHIL